MQKLNLYLVVTIILLGAGCSGTTQSKAGLRSNAKGFISVKGKTNDRQEPTSFWVNINKDNESWQAGEIGSTSEVFITKSGKYIYNPIPTGATLLQSANGKTNIAQLTGFNPATAKEADTGRFYSEEKARTGTWTVIK